MPEACENCGKEIGKLETPNIWQQHVVCSDCHQKLSAERPRNDNQQTRGAARAANIVAVFLVVIGLLAVIADKVNHDDSDFGMAMIAILIGVAFAIVGASIKGRSEPPETGGMRRW